MALRPVGEDERAEPPAEPVAPPTLTEAVESGDVLDMLLAQRRMIAETMTHAAENTRPQLNNELNKLHVLIREEQVRRAVEAAEAEAAAAKSGGGAAGDRFDADAV